MSNSWKPYLVLFIILMPIALCLGGWKMIELGACKAKDIGNWYECSVEILYGAEFIFIGEDK